MFHKIGAHGSLTVAGLRVGRERWLTGTGSAQMMLPNITLPLSFCAVASPPKGISALLLSPPSFPSLDTLLHTSPILRGQVFSNSTINSSYLFPALVSCRVGPAMWQAEYPPWDIE